MPKAAAKLNLSQVGRVCVTVADTDRAIDFYVDTLGFEKVVDVPMGPDMRWVEVAITGTPTTIALAPPPEGQEAGGSQTGICLDTSDVDADHAALQAAGVDVDEQAPAGAARCRRCSGCATRTETHSSSSSRRRSSSTQARPAHTVGRASRTLVRRRRILIVRARDEGSASIALCLRRPPADFERSRDIGDRQKPGQVSVVDHERPVRPRR